MSQSETILVYVDKITELGINNLFLIFIIYNTIKYFTIADICKLFFH